MAQNKTVSMLLRPRPAHGIALCVSLLIVSIFLSPPPQASAQGSLYPFFTGVSCGDREVRLAWSDTVEVRLGQIRDSLRALGQPVPNSLKFGGYRLWRSETPDTLRMVLLREFTRADTVSWTFLGRVRQFVDPDSVFEIRLVKTRVGYDSVYVRLRVRLDIPGPFNGMGYYYSVTYFDSVGTQRSAKADCFTYMPVHSVAPQNRNIERVWVVPNPYHGGSPWDASEGRRIQFVNLPSVAKVSIYTVTGELVTVLNHPDLNYFNYGNYGGALNWNLTNEYGEEVVPGVYIFHVEAPDGEEYRGHFVIIR
ncbi:MAG: hypothetical protein V2A71_02685 [Candidatus Eisenbacteria bacterium]